MILQYRTLKSKILKTNRKKKLNTVNPQVPLIKDSQLQCQETYHAVEATIHYQ